jgi:hypothetical protein
MCKWYVQVVCASGMCKWYVQVYERLLAWEK